MAGTFFERMDELQEKVGPGQLIMRANVHQPYAAAEHQRVYYKHPRGGGPKFLERPFDEQHPEMLERLASGFPDLEETAIEVAEMFSDMVDQNAPVRADVLRLSTNVYVEDSEKGQIYYRPQTAPYESWKE